MRTLDNLNTLDEMDQDQLTALPFYITVLIAGADGTIDHAEIKRAANFSKVAAKSKSERIISFYDNVSHDFEDKLKVVISSLPRQKEEEKRYLFTQIAKAGSILKKIDRAFGRELCDSFRELAKNIASASGGILGYGSIGKEESRLIDLHMIEFAS